MSQWCMLNVLNLSFFFSICWLVYLHNVWFMAIRFSLFRTLLLVNLYISLRFGMSPKSKYWPMPHLVNSGIYIFLWNQLSMKYSALLYLYLQIHTTHSNTQSQVCVYIWCLSAKLPQTSESQTRQGSLTFGCLCICKLTSLLSRGSQDKTLTYTHNHVHSCTSLPLKERRPIVTLCVR